MNVGNEDGGVNPATNDPGKYSLHFAITMITLCASSSEFKSAAV